MYCIMSLYVLMCECMHLGPESVGLVNRWPFPAHSALGYGSQSKNTSTHTAAHTNAPVAPVALVHGTSIARPVA